MSYLPVVTLRISAFRFLITSTPLGFTSSLIGLWSALLFFQIVPRGLGFAMVGLFLSVGLIGYALSSHNFSFRNLSKDHTTCLHGLAALTHLVRGVIHRSAEQTIGKIVSSSRRTFTP